jgi:hypothetical protein
MLQTHAIEWQDEENPVHAFKRLERERVTQEGKRIFGDSRIKKAEK